MKSLNKKNILGQGLRNIYMAVVLLMVVSCGEEFIDIIPEDSVDKSSFYSNEAELLLAINGVYRKANEFYGGTLSFQVREGRSDDTGIDQQDQPERIDTETFEEENNSQVVLGEWFNLYEIVDHANAVIVNGPNAEPIGPNGQNEINQYIAEAQFFRALAYFDIVVLFGGNAPLRLTPSVDFGPDIIEPSSSIDALYNQVIQDLQDAIAILPATSNGRVNSLAANALLGKVQLQRGDVSSALSALRQVEGQFSLLPDFADIYRAGNNNHAESVFELSFDKDNFSLGLANNFVHESEMMRLGLLGGTQRENLLFYPTPDLMTAFTDPMDLRAASTFALEDDLPTGLPYIAKFIDGVGSAEPDINVILIRYADILLSLAEAVGESPEAYEYINQVRRRGYGLDPNIPSAVDIDQSTPGTFNEKLLNERRLELAFEGHRWRDLLRLNDANTVAGLMQNHIFNLLGKNVNITPERLLYPIPFIEVDLAGGMVNQNPGHE